MLNFEPINIAKNVSWELAQHVLGCLPGLRNPHLVSKQNEKKKQYLSSLLTCTHYATPEAMA